MYRKTQCAQVYTSVHSLRRCTSEGSQTSLQKHHYSLAFSRGWVLWPEPNNATSKFTHMQTPQAAKPAGLRSIAQTSPHGQMLQPCANVMGRANAPYRIFPSPGSLARHTFRTAPSLCMCRVECVSAQVGGSALVFGTGTSMASAHLQCGTARGSIDVHAQG